MVFVHTTPEASTTNLKMEEDENPEDGETPEEKEKEEKVAE